MKAIIEYDLNDPEEMSAYKVAIKSMDLAMALWDITHNTKKNLEWSMEGKEISKYDVLEMVFESIHDILENHNISLKDLE